MTVELAIPAALQLLRNLLLNGAAIEELLVPLRALQLRGLSKLDLTVQIERMRAANSATNDDEMFDELCLAALDVVHGAIPDSLIWDAAHEAASLLPRCLGQESLNAAMEFALAPSDLLPPRAAIAGEHLALTERLALAAYEVIEAFEMRPQQAEIVRAPKSPFTTRPAAVLTFPDRLVLEALTTTVEQNLASELPEAVVWPRSRGVGGSMSYNEHVLAWGTSHVVKADISNFYESVDHSLLAVFLISHLRISTLTARAIEAVLTSTMGFGRGLPQGPLASDVLASAYLLPIDSRLAAEGQAYPEFRS